MKEISIEEKAKAYDDLLVKLQKAKEDNDVCDDRYCCVIDAIVPELAESEDERTRKEIVRFIQMEVEDEIVGNKWLAWLEKRGEEHTLENVTKTFLEALSQTPYNNMPIVQAQASAKQLLTFLTDPKSYNPDSEVVPKFSVGQRIRNRRGEMPAFVIDRIENDSYKGENGESISVVFQDDWELVEQKPAEWSEEDDQYLLVCKNALRKYQVTDKWDSNIISQWLDNKLKSLKDRVQPKQEWSEEDERMLNTTINTVLIARNSCEEDDEVKDKYDDELRWLKALKDRVGCEVNCTTEWKPTVEQMDALYYVLQHYTPEATDRLAWDAMKTVEIMRMQLNKLKQEVCR